MIESGVLHKMRNGVCAIGYLAAPLETYKKAFTVPGMFTVVGTGFLVRDRTVITCAHVLDDLEKERLAKGIPEGQLFLMFVVPRPPRLKLTVRLIRRRDCVRTGSVDVGFIDFEIVFPEDFDGIASLEVQQSGKVTISERIAAFGYPHGSTLSEKDGRVRYGPILQQGWVSGLSPYDGAARPEEILLDLRADEGMSGAPIFRPVTGEVIGILQSGLSAAPGNERFGTTTVFGQPLVRGELFKWLAEYDLDGEPPDVPINLVTR